MNGKKKKKNRERRKRKKHEEGKSVEDFFLNLPPTKVNFRFLIGDGRETVQIKSKKSTIYSKI